MSIHPITPCLWFNHEAESAANFYVSVFKNSKLGDISHYTKEGFETHGQEAGTVMTVSFTLNGQPFTALNGGPAFQFNEAISLQVLCDTQEEIDTYWNKLSDGGETSQCGWLKDKFGVWWQVSPAIMSSLFTDPSNAEKVMKVMLQMKKFDLQRILDAANS